MVTSRSRRGFRAIIAALALSVTAPAHAVVYKWIEDDDNVIYSNEPPADPGKVRELTRIEDMRLVPGERNPELVPLDQPRASAVRGVERGGAPGAVATPRPQILLHGEPVTLLPREPAAAPRSAEPPPQRYMPRSTHTGAVQDPCLVSPDPRCHEQHRGSYHPFAGYVPPGGASVGATPDAGAGGAVGSQAQASAPTRGAQALPPGSPSAVSVEWSTR